MMSGSKKKVVPSSGKMGNVGQGKAREKKVTPFENSGEIGVDARSNQRKGTAATNLRHIR